MFKYTFILSLMIIGALVWANQSESCEACGKECKSACGTKKFRLCCQNYMRRKRVSEAFMFLVPAGNTPSYLENSAQALSQDTYQNKAYSNDVLAMYLMKHYYDKALVYAPELFEEISS